LTEHISQQILYSKHPEPESNYRLENPSKFLSVFCPTCYLFIYHLFATCLMVVFN